MPCRKIYTKLIAEYTSEINKAFNLSCKLYNNKKIFGNIDKIDYVLNISRNLTDYDEEIIIAGLLYNPYLESINLKHHCFNKNVRKICKDTYFINFFSLLNNYNISEEEIKEYIIQPFYKIESVLIVFGEVITILDYLDKIKDQKYKKRFLNIVEKSIIPLAYQLGVYNIKDKILNKLIEIKYPKKFLNIKKYLEKNFPKNNLEIFKEIIIDYLKSRSLKPLFYEYRYKSAGSFYQKVYVNRLVTIDNITDVYALRLIFETKKDCYKALNLIKNNFLLYNSRITDMIKNPKKNGYQSIHLRLNINGYPVEVQIRTAEMHNNAIYGVSSHFHYKNISELSLKESKILDYLKSETSLSVNKSSDYKDYITVFTTTNQKIVVPKKATIFDFAFYLHTTFVMYFDYAIVNGVAIRNKNYLLKNGDEITIVRSRKITLEADDRKYLFVNKNKKQFNLVLNKVDRLLSEQNIVD